jgi:hypothetical protein
VISKSVSCCCRCCCCGPGLEGDGASFGFWALDEVRPGDPLKAPPREGLPSGCFWGLPGGRIELVWDNEGAAAGRLARL